MIYFRRLLKLVLCCQQEVKVSCIGIMNSLMVNLTFIKHISLKICSDKKLGATKSNNFGLIAGKRLSQRESTK